MACVFHVLSQSSLPFHKPKFGETKTISQHGSDEYFLLWTIWAWRRNKPRLSHEYMCDLGYTQEENRDIFNSFKSMGTFPDYRMKEAKLNFYIFPIKRDKLSQKNGMGCNSIMNPDLLQSGPHFPTTGSELYYYWAVSHTVFSFQKLFCTYASEGAFQLRHKSS